MWSLPRMLKALSMLLVMAFCLGCVPVEVTVVEPTPALPVWNEAVSAVTELANFGNPMDATPSPDGTMVYFTSAGEVGPGVYAVPADGGELQTLLAHEPLVTPLGIAVSSDGATLFVADAGAGWVWSIPTEGGEAAVLAGTEGTAPVGIEVKPGPAGDLVYFSGRQADTPGVWQVAAEGGTAAVLAQGAPLVSPMGIAVAADGTVYVVDHDASGNELGSVFRLAGGQVETIADHFQAGHQAGAALTLDDSILLVSALDAQAGTAQVLLIKLPTLEKGIVTKVISANHGSGGIHRAHDVNFFAWADSPAPAQGGRPKAPGHVYGVEP